MKKFIATTMIAICLALCATVWPQREVIEEIPEPTQTIAVNTLETPAVTPKEEPKALPQAEEENVDIPQPEMPLETISKPEPVPMKIPMIPEAQPTPEPNPTVESAPEPTPAQTVIAPQSSDMVYVPGFGWMESQGEGTVVHDDMIYENGNKVGSMGLSE